MKAYEDLLYEQWRQQVEATLPILLKRNLLAKPDTAGSVKSESSDGGKEFSLFRAPAINKGFQTRVLSESFGCRGANKKHGISL